MAKKHSRVPVVEELPPPQAGKNGGPPPKHSSGTDSTRPTLPLPPPVTGSWIAEHPPTLPDELVHNLLHKGCKMVLGGGSKSFKTWALADLALSIATGSSWWGLQTSPGLVVYLNFEIQAGFFHSRLRQIADAKNVDLTDNVLVWNLRGHARPASEILPEIARTLHGRDVAAIIIDPVYKLAFGMDENAARDTAVLLNEFELLAESTGAAIIFGAHFSKGNQAGKEAMDRISGSGVYARDPDAILTMTRHAEDNAFTIETTLRNCPSLPPFVVRWNFPLMEHAPGLDPGQLKLVRPAGAKRAYGADDIVTIMPLGMPLKAKEW